MVFENAVLYLRDELLLREMADPIKVRGSVRVVLVLKFLAASYQGAENVKYAHEMMQLLYFFKHVWSPGLRRIMLSNWLLTSTGHKNVFVELDLLQEHLNV
ncbi:hypothetical protein BDV98DRAFT_598645 [Pterulicium gracile]|uniref:DUF6589 domain-containing protein n=1 Tax=Pterulicium gracile TaxID=1884261 RepID=A0A5C3Q0N2_9AGAR|nr:hypothetical protein BDV98DRAFT_598645 [Pterula gracilis]